MEGSGCYGHNGADDAAADAALVARALPGRPVRVQWMREDEHGWEPFGPAMLSKRARRVLDGTARRDWQYEVWSNTHSTRPGPAGDLAAGVAGREAVHAAAAARRSRSPTGGGDRNAIPLYRFANSRVVHHFVPEMPLRVSALRALGAYMNMFSIESFMDELAAAARADPVEFRLRHLQDPRAQAVVRTAAERFGWQAWKKQPGRGRGFAFARYKNLAAYTAVACEVEVDRDSGRVRVGRVVAADDSGEIVNPDGIVNQIEGGIVQSLSWTLHEAVAFDRDADHEPRLGRLSDPALPDRAAERRGARHRSPGPAVPRHRRGGAGPDRRGARERVRRRDRRALARAAVHCRASEAGARRLT